MPGPRSGSGQGDPAKGSTCRAGKAVAARARRAGPKTKSSAASEIEKCGSEGPEGAPRDAVDENREQGEAAPEVHRVGRTQRWFRKTSRRDALFRAQQAPLVAAELLRPERDGTTGSLRPVGRAECQKKGMSQRWIEAIPVRK